MSVSIAHYFDALTEERNAVMQKLWRVIDQHLPPGVESWLQHGMPSWVVPHSLYAPGYHVRSELPLPFLSIASQNRHIAISHMGL
jgi:hypothetical protein